MKFRIPLPTQKELIELFDYHPNGILTSKYAKTNRKIGAVVGVKNKYGYLSAKLNKKTYYVHRLIWTICNGTIPEGFDVDHINGNRSDNIIKNLRLVTRQGNNQNLRSAKSNSKTKLLGACFHKRSKKFVAQIRENGKYKYLGLFDTALDAHNAYLKRKREIHETCQI
jgi:hypothetical protein